MSRREFYSSIGVIEESFDPVKTEERIFNFRKKTVEEYLVDGWSLVGSNGNYYIITPRIKKKFSIWDDFDPKEISNEVFSKIDSKIDRNLNSDFNTEYEYEFAKEFVWENLGYKGISKEIDTAKGLVKILRKIPEEVRECLVKTYNKIRS